MGYLVNNTGSSTDTYNPITIDIANFTNSNVIGAEAIYTSFTNGFLISMDYRVVFDPGTTFGRCKLPLPNNTQTNIQSRIKGTWSYIPVNTTVFSSFTISKDLTDNLNPINFNGQTLTPGSTINISLLIHIFI